MNMQTITHGPSRADFIAEEAAKIKALTPAQIEAEKEDRKERGRRAIRLSDAPKFQGDEQLIGYLQPFFMT